MYELHGGKRKRFHIKFLSTLDSLNTQRIRDLYLKDYRDGVLLRPIYWMDYDTPAKYQGNIEGVIVAVCGSNNDKKSWI